ncbi:DEKNAAC103425 [Brettanomyces naardenensis]|uniref:DEKNAAC103425 n=1 Tax=Brettanomyces naardenensis TaxID=13370 RepID=A0A448YN65_BRENA|nr:DEKNAAC103425 [Brettanomyces naardenensis]
MDPSNVLLMAKAAPKMQTVIADYLVNELDCLFEPLKLSDSFLRSMADSNVDSTEDMKDVGGIELAFTGIRTKSGALNTMILNVGGEDLQKFKGKNGFTANLCDHISREVSIDLSKLELGRVRSELFSMGSDGRVRFSSLMSYRGNPEDFGDDRVSIWMVLSSLLSEASNSAGELSASKQ